MLVGQGKYAQAELDAMQNSDAVGPVGCLATAALLGRLDPKAARSFAERGVARLTVAEFHKDYRILLQGDSVASQTLGNLLSLLRGLREDQVNSLSAFLKPDQAALVQQVAQLLRQAPDKPPGEAAWPAIEQQWDKTIRPCLQSGLNHFLPQVQLLSDPQALYDRGLSLISSDSLMRDEVEAAQCFRKAAAMGHGGAQLRLGFCYEKGSGVTKDYAEAMRWYRQALASKQPHAACRIGDLYRDGNGVDRDLKEAARWYRQEAERNCTGAQANLGRICETQDNLPEAMKWFRRAAEGGERTAQIHLADLLSEGIAVTPDNVEACKWLLLAAQDPKDRIVQASLRTIKARLSPEQLDEAQRRADAITQRLTEQEEARKQKTPATNSPASTTKTDGKSRVPAAATGGGQAN